jgi:signal transduction histidine kinase
MSFVLGKRDFTAARFRAALPYFLILWLGIVLTLVCLTFFLKRQLQNEEICDVEKRLDSYLADNPISSLIDITGQKSAAGILQGLAFIRLVKSSDQVLLAESSTAQIDFQKLSGLDPKVSGIWITLDHPESRGPWTIVARRLPADMSIQAGKEDARAGLLYERMMGIVRLVVFLWVIPAWGLALAFVRDRFSSMKKVSADIAAILADGRVGLLLPVDHADNDLADLYGQLNHLLQYNRRLIAEMQASLDNVAHDLRTPMTRLRAVAEYGLQADAAPEQLRDALSDCLEESERVLSMLKIMMTVAEAESGTMHLQREWIDLAASLVDVVSLYEYVAEERRIAVRIDLQPGLRILADRTRIAQVWANLLDNSIKYGKEGGNVVISSRSDGGDAVIVFADDGIGISKNEIHRIWERLYRGDRSRTQPGLGLGLNYVRAVVAAHGGTVSVESELQKGTRLTIRLRYSQSASTGESMNLRSQISGA